jgi:hypothetical protein
MYQHPLAYLLGMERLALMRAWRGEYDEGFVRARFSEVRALLDDEALTGHPGVHVIHGATHDAYRQWAPSYNDPGNELLELDLPVIDDILADVPAGEAVDAACGTGRLAAKLAARDTRSLGSTTLKRWWNRHAVTFAASGSWWGVSKAFRWLRTRRM